MSAFLGPIHHWLYNKINLQDKLTEEILAYADKNGKNQIREQVNASFGQIPEGSLETIIDENNIHGWLQDKIILVENRYAKAITEILKQDPKAISELETIVEEFGKKNSTVTPQMSATEAYQLLNDTLIDGMPCDHVNMLIDQDANKVEWKRTQCVHTPYWVANEGDINVYYQLRNKLVTGLLENGAFTFEAHEDGTYKITK